MAYDEHWSSSAAGPVASLKFCRNVANYALSVLGREKTVMGVPFYGRSWGSTSGNRGLLDSGVKRILNENDVHEIRRRDGTPYFSYEVPLRVTVYYDDLQSHSERLELYRSLGVKALSFWRLGQESPSFWKILKLGPN
jgi:spore germination protein YaaH